MKLEYFNCPSAKAFGDISLPIDVEFLSYEPDFGAIKQIAEKYASYKNILVIGHGGSINSFYGIYSALEAKATKAAYFLSTVDPDDIAWMKQQLSPENTLVIAISKSGETVTQIEALAQFLDFPLLFITGAETALAQIAKARGGEVIAHPSIGGRYTGFTEIALLPAALCGFDIEAIFQAGRAMHQKFNEDNEAWQAASVLVQLEEKGYIDVFLPFYSHAAFGMSKLIVQLCHESFGKNGLGQTYFAHESPESQHHTNQRFLDGRKNIVGFFVSVENFNNNLVTQIPDEMGSIPIKLNELKVLNNIPLAKSMQYEMEATLQDAKDLGIPGAHLSLSQLDEKELGQFMAFWQMYAVYGALIRGVNPFDQPAVENSKRISFQKRLEFKK
jgi:glucose-6-phosphate isomerase